MAVGYDGPSADEIAHMVTEGTEASLWLQDPTGQCPPNGRTDNHVFNDVLYQLIFEVTAERLFEAGEPGSRRPVSAGCRTCFFKVSSGG